MIKVIKESNTDRHPQEQRLKKTPDPSFLRMTAWGWTV
jgi:hypothetical protein